MKKFWLNLTFFWKVYLSAIVLIISVIFVAEFSEDIIPYVTNFRQLNQAELESLLHEYAESGEDQHAWRERLNKHGIWLFDAPLHSLRLASDAAPGQPLVISILPESDDWEDEWVIVEKLLPDGRLLAMGLPEPAYSDYFDAVLWMSVIAAFAGAACYYLSKFLTSRLSEISSATRQLAAGDIKSRVSVAPEGGDEFSDLARLFNKMAANVEQAIENERRLLYDISHELRSPLARMRLSLDLLRRRDKDCSAEYLNILEDDTKRMTMIMDAIMEQSKSSVSPVDFAEPFDLVELLEESIRLANFEIRRGGKNVCCELTARPKGALWLEASRSLVEQAIHNLLSNAVRYTPEGSRVDVSVELGMWEESGQVCITVRDYGPGVPEDCLLKLFRPFFRVDEARDQHSGGVGLGLALAHEYVKRHRGTITAMNRHPGLAVRMTLPLKISA